MPYYVFSVKPFAQYAKRAEFGVFREASAHAKALRGQVAAGSGEQIKVMFADTEDHAVDLLCQPREAGPSGDD
jgi:hypothetical protein